MQRPAETTGPLAKARGNSKFHLGIDYVAQFTCLEYRASVIATMHPFNATLGRLGVIATSYYDTAQPLVFTVLAATPAAAAGPATITASKAILAPNHNKALLYGPTLRKIPLRLALLPYTSGGNVIAYATT